MGFNSYITSVNEKTNTDELRTILTGFCSNNDMPIDNDTLDSIILYASDSDSMWGRLLEDMDSNSTLVDLRTNGKSSKWLRYYFCLSGVNFVVLPNKEMYSVSLNFFSDVISFYDSSKESSGVIYALKKTNEGLCLNLTSRDIDVLRGILSDSGVELGSDKISLVKSDDLILTEKYSG